MARIKVPGVARRSTTAQNNARRPASSPPVELTFIAFESPPTSVLPKITCQLSHTFDTVLKKVREFSRTWIPELFRGVRIVLICEDARGNRIKQVPIKSNTPSNTKLSSLIDSNGCTRIRMHVIGWRPIRPDHHVATQLRPYVLRI